MSLISKNIKVHRGDYTELKFKIAGDYSAKKLYFTVKADRVLTSVRYIDLANTLGGGSDTEIKATYDGNNFTDISVFIQESHTQSLTQKTLVYDLIEDDGTKPVTLFDGNFNLEFDVRTPTDNTSVPAADYTNQLFSKAMIYKVNSDGTGTEKKDQGFNATVTPSRLSEGMYKLVSDVDLFAADTVLRFTPVGINTSNTVLNFAPIFNHNLGLNNKELVIGVTNYNDGGVMDTNFLIGIYKVR